ncbi:MAG: T9SS type A sorting domain-containing protein [Saprospiraceae bacterium]|jgi:hypothetical protein|nr:T9SS type A sorting domain-containing protein [Saprospiraceae bacterium]MBP6566594.1 T9SS type A sorting domain-containing protein [Saprospiraceae bacterium]
MSVKHKILLFCLLISMVSALNISSQTVENLIKVHTKSNSFLSPKKLERIGDHVYTFMHFNNKDSLFIDGELQNDLLKTVNTLTGNYTLIVSKFDLDHKLKKTSVFSGNNMGYKNMQIYDKKIYLFINVTHNPSIQYNSEEIWSASKIHEWGGDSWNVMVVLDEDLQLLEVKGIDHYNSGFDGIAFGKDRMYLCGYFTNTMDAADTIEVDGYKLINTSNTWGVKTSFMLTYDTQTGNIIHSERFTVNHFPLYVGTNNVVVGIDGNVYQLVMSSASNFIYKEIELQLFYPASSNILIKYTPDGKVEKLVNLVKNNSTEMYDMEISRDGDILLYGNCFYGVALNGVEVIKTHLPFAAVLMSLDGKDLSLKWFDYMASEQNSSGLSMRIGGMTIDTENNIYIMNSNGIDLLAEDRDGNTLRPGNHIYKYNKDGKRLSDFRSQFGKPFFLSTKGVDTLIIMKGVGSIKGSFDSLLNITNNYGNPKEFALFQFILNKTSSLDDVQEIDKMSIYPNPVHKDGILKIASDKEIYDKKYTIIDMLGHIVARGITELNGQINLYPHHLRSGIYFIKLMGLETMTYKVVVVE